jgi:diguanylate cyclase (GGDEF)-like protein
LHLLRNIGIARSFVLAALLPTVVSVSFAFEAVVRDREQAREMTLLSSMVTLSTGMSRLVHELQRERGISAAFTASDGAAFAQRLDGQRVETDAERTALREALADFAARTPSVHAVLGMGSLADALDSIPDHRALVDQGDIDVGEAVSFYTRLNERMFDIVGRVAQRASEPETITTLLGYDLFMRGKDLAGLERATGAAAFAADRLSPDAAARLHTLISDQNTYLGLAADLLGEQLAREVRIALQSPASTEVQRMRAVLREGTPTDIAAVSHDAWWRVTTVRIDALKQLEDRIAAGMTARMAALRDAADSHEAYTIRMALISVLGAALISGGLGLSVRRSFRETLASTERLTAGDYETPAPPVSANELGRLNAALDVFRERAALADTMTMCAEKSRESANQEARRLSELNEWLQASRSLDELYDLVRNAMAQLLPRCKGALYVYSNSRDVLDGACAWNGAYLHDHVKPDDCWGLRRGRHYAFGAGELDVPCSHYSAQVKGLAALGYPHLCIPILAHGETIGLLSLETEEASHIADAADCSIALALFTDNRRIAQLCAEQISVAVANVRLRDQLHDRSVRDPLTGLFNRRHFGEMMRRWFGKAQHSGHPVALISIDIDHFKKFNDNHGHDAGDLVLRSVATVLSDACDGDEIACRLGGEELCLVLPGTDLGGAVQKAEGLRASVEALAVRYGEKTLPTVTISLGVAVAPGGWATMDAMVNAADARLYEAKGAGRNCVRVADDAEATAPPPAAAPRVLGLAAGAA